MAPVRGGKALSPKGGLQLVVDVSPPAGQGTKPRHKWMWWVVTGILAFLVVITGGAFLASLLSQSDYPPAPSAWNGNSVSLEPRRLREPSPFPVDFDEAQRIVEAHDLALVEYDPDCGFTAQICRIYEGRGTTVEIRGYLGGPLTYVKFRMDLKKMTAATQMFNQIVWEMGLEKQAEWARQTVDRELAPAGLPNGAWVNGRFVEAWIEGIRVVPYGYYGTLVVHFSNEK